MSLQDTDSYTIRKLFEEPFRFEIPSYQRAYSWDVSTGGCQVPRFIADLEEQHPGKTYYLGHFLFERAVPGILHVIDGQQRLTTVVIFFAALIQELESRNSKSDGTQSTLDLARLRETYLSRGGERRFQTVSADQSFFRSRILDRASSDPGDTDSRRRIAEADFWMKKKFGEIPTNELERWATLVETAAITTFPVADKIQATQIFAFQNDRGKNLTELEKLKAFLMYQVYLNCEQGREVHAIRDLESDFGEIYTIIPRLKLGEDQVLSHHCTAYLRHWGGAMDSIKSVLRKSLSQQETVRWITDFVSALRGTFSHIESLENLARHHPCIADPLILDASNSWPLLLKLFRIHRDELLSPRFARLLRLVELATFKRFFLHGRCANDLPTWAFHHEAGQEDVLRERLESVSLHSFRGGQDCGAAFRGALAGNYHWTPLFRYLLWKYENSIRLNGDYPITPEVYVNELNDPRMGSTLDHIIPRNPSDHTHEHSFTNECLNDLGNLMLMTHCLNASYRNKMPLEKVDKMLGSSLASHREVGRAIQTDGGWGRSQIEARKKRIVAFALKNWEATSPTRTTEDTATSS